MVSRQIALLDHAADHREKRFVQGFTRSGKLLGNFFAILLFFDLTLHTTQLPFYASQTGANCFFLDGVCESCQVDVDKSVE